MKTCRTCGLRAVLPQGGDICRLSRLRIDLNNDYCSHHNENPSQCSLCGTVIPDLTGTFVVPVGETWDLLCIQCAQHFALCGTCKLSAKCDFEDAGLYPAIAPVIMQTQQHGNMVMQTQVRNPEREKVTCHSCICWDKENLICLKSSLGCCTSWDYIHQG